MSSDYSPDELRSREAANRTQVPAILLLIVGIINLLVAGGLLIRVLPLMTMDDAKLKAEMDKAWEQMDEKQRKQLREGGFSKEDLIEMMRKIPYYVVGGAGIASFAAVLTIFGAWCMLKLRAHWLAVTGAALACLPVLSPLGCCLVGEVVGIWSLVVLFNSDVSAAFGRPRDEGIADPPL
jgi:hypothetical protein